MVVVGVFSGEKRCSSRAAKRHGTVMLGKRGPLVYHMLFDGGHDSGQVSHPRVEIVGNDKDDIGLIGLGGASLRSCCCSAQKGDCAKESARNHGGERGY